jgi:hypothetical protein
MDRMKTSNVRDMLRLCLPVLSTATDFSANKYHEDRTRIKWFVRVLAFQADHDDLEATRDLMCTE